MKKFIPFFILSFLIVATGVSFSQVPVMRGLPLSPETKSLFNRGTPSDESGNKSVWGGKEKNTSSWGRKRTLKSRPGAEPEDEIALKKRARSRGVFEDPCPPSARLARKKARMDAGIFAKKTPWGTWDLFMHKFRQQYATCSPFIKRAYLEAAKDILAPKKKAMFSR
jgi:hypothetical protein